jgi:enolase
MSIIKDILAREILDSRGHPTPEVKVILQSGVVGISSVPSGASVGKYEALELRDNDPKRYQQKGVLKSIEKITAVIKPRLLGLNARDQLKIDQTLISLDDSPRKEHLGANSTLGASQAVCKAAANFEKIPLYLHISHLYGAAGDFKIPTPIFNLINGGKHGAGNLDFQEFHLIPAETKSFSQSLQLGVEVYHQLRNVLIRNQASHAVGDEGGFAPNLLTNQDALEALKAAITEAGYTFKKDVFLGLDLAANTFYVDNKYSIKDSTTPLTPDELMDIYSQLVNNYGLVSLEDPFFEDDWRSWSKLTSLFPLVLIIGDDLLATSKQRVEEAIEKKACSAILVKPNQIGTIGETIEVIKTARKANWKTVISHRSGETTDDFIADFAVGVHSDFCKFGAPARGERVVKYNRLLEIESELKHV